MNKTYTVIYRTGVRENFRWHECAASPTHEAARKTADDLERMGYLTRIHPTDAIRSIGLPETYGPEMDLTHPAQRRMQVRQQAAIRATFGGGGR